MKMKIMVPLRMKMRSLKTNKSRSPTKMELKMTVKMAEIKLPLKIESMKMKTFPVDRSVKASLALENACVKTVSPMKIKNSGSR